MKQAIRYVIVLLIICGAAAALLATVFAVTKEPIARSRQEKTMNAVRTVLPPADRVIMDAAELTTLLRTSPGDTDIPEMYPAFLGDRFVGAAIKVVEPSGYSGNIELMVGVTAEGRVNAISVLQHKETPGLGSKITQGPFSGQFKDLPVPDQGLKVKKDGGTIDAITGATISSRAVSKGVSEAVQKFLQFKPRLAPSPAPAAGGNHG